jgi:hypothetical protein
MGQREPTVTSRAIHEYAGLFLPCNHLTKLDRMGTLVLLCRTRLAVDVMIPMRLSSGAAALGHIPHHVCNLGWNLFALSSLFV